VDAHGWVLHLRGARDARVDRLDERHRRYEEERKRLEEMIKEMKRKAA
jgi:chromosome segregation ATPase